MNFNIKETVVTAATYNNKVCFNFLVIYKPVHLYLCHRQKLTSKADSWLQPIFSVSCNPLRFLIILAAHSLHHAFCDITHGYGGKNGYLEPKLRI